VGGEESGGGHHIGCSVSCERLTKLRSRETKKLYGKEKKVIGEPKRGKEGTGLIAITKTDRKVTTQRERVFASRVIRSFRGTTLGPYLFN